MKPGVAHFNYSFFTKSETFIHNYVSRHERFFPVCVGRKFENLDLFQFPIKNTCTVSPAKFTPAWLYQGAVKKMTGRNFRVEKFLKARGVQVIHAHFGTTGPEALAYKKALGVPLITTFYGADVSAFGRMPEWMKKYKILFEGGDLFLVEGAHMKKKLMELGCPENKIQIQRIAIPLDRLVYRTRKPKGKDEKKIFIFSGRFIEKKGILQAIQAMKLVSKTRRDFEFRVIGDGPLKPEIEALIQKENMADRVKLLGFLNYAEYLSEMEKADIFVHPSVTAANGDSEGGAPTTIIEAQALGMPVVASLHADIPNITAPDKSALLSEERALEPLAENLIRLLDSPEIWERMGRAGRNFVENYHDIAHEIKNLEDHYENICLQGHGQIPASQEEETELTL